MNKKRRLCVLILLLLFFLAHLLSFFPLFSFNLVTKKLNLTFRICTHITMCVYTYVYAWMSEVAFLIHSSCSFSLSILSSNSLLTPYGHSLTHSFILSFNITTTTKHSFYMYALSCCFHLNVSYKMNFTRLLILWCI